MIDRNRLNELKEEIGEEDFGEIAEIFLEEMAEIMEALCANPSGATSADFHELRGSASNLGFSGFAEACGVAEKNAAIGGAVDISALDQLYKASVTAAAPDLLIAAT